MWFKNCFEVQNYCPNHIQFEIIWEGTKTLLIFKIKNSLRVCGSGPSWNILRSFYLINKECKNFTRYFLWTYLARIRKFCIWIVMHFGLILDTKNNISWGKVLAVTLNLLNYYRSLRSCKYKWTFCNSLRVFSTMKNEKRHIKWRKRFWRNYETFLN